MFLRAVSGPVLVPEPPNRCRSSSVAEQVEQHDRVGLLGQHVAVGIVSLGAQDPVQPLDPAVLRAVRVPVELGKLLVALELADDAVAVERDEHLAAHLVPRSDLVGRQPEPVRQRLAAALGQEAEHLAAVSAIHATMTFV